MAANKQLLAQCESWRASVVTYKDMFIAYSGRTDSVEPQTEKLANRWSPRAPVIFEH